MRTNSSSIVNDNILTEIQKVLMKINAQLENIETHLKKYEPKEEKKQLLND